MDVKRLEQQINLLIEQFRSCRTTSKTRIILSSIGGLLELYEEIMKEELKKISEIEAINPYYYQKYVEYNNQKRNLFMREFIKNREIHYQFILEIINKFNFLDYESEYIKPRYYPKSELEGIFKSFSIKNNPNLYSIYDSFKNDNRIYISDQHSCCAQTTYDWYNSLAFILIGFSDKTIENLVSLVHELGHIEDELDLSDSKKIDYRDKSIFTEVHSLYREKQLYDFLLTSGLYVEEIKSEVLFEPHALLELLMNILIFCKIPRNYLNSKDFKYQWVEDGLSEVKDGLDIFLNNYECIDLYDSLIYSYGEILSTYFLDNGDKYMTFRENRYDSYSPKMLSSLDITSDDIVKSLYKRYDKYMKVK